MKTCKLVVGKRVAFIDGDWQSDDLVFQTYLRMRFPIDGSPQMGMAGVSECRAAAKALGGHAMFKPQAAVPFDPDVVY